MQAELGPGWPKRGATVRQTAREEALASPRLQLRMPSLAVSLGLKVELEPKLPGAETRADLLISDGAASLAVEVMAVLRNKKSLGCRQVARPVQS